MLEALFVDESAEKRALYQPLRSEIIENRQGPFGAIYSAPVLPIGRPLMFRPPHGGVAFHFSPPKLYKEIEPIKGELLRMHHPHSSASQTKLSTERRHLMHRDANPPIGTDRCSQIPLGKWDVNFALRCMGAWKVYILMS